MTDLIERLRAEYRRLLPSARYDDKVAANLHGEAAAALEAEASEGERRGLVLVPREPTKAMLHAKPGTSSTHHETYMRALWAAMLDAALIPEAPVREGE